MTSQIEGGLHASVRMLRGRRSNRALQVLRLQILLKDFGPQSPTMWSGM